MSRGWVLPVFYIYKEFNSDFCGFWCSGVAELALMLNVYSVLCNWPQNWQGIELKNRASCSDQSTGRSCSVSILVVRSLLVFPSTIAFRSLGDKKARRIHFYILPSSIFWFCIIISCTAVTICDPTRMSEADNIPMVQYLALIGLAGAYFAPRNRGGNLWYAFY